MSLPMLGASPGACPRLAGLCLGEAVEDAFEGLSTEEIAEAPGAGLPAFPARPWGWRSRGCCPGRRAAA